MNTQMALADFTDIPNLCSKNLWQLHNCFLTMKSADFLTRKLSNFSKNMFLTQPFPKQLDFRAKMAAFHINIELFMK